MIIKSLLYLDLFILIEAIAAMMYIVTPEMEMERKKQLPLRWKGNEELPIELKDADVDFSHVPEFECIIGPLCQIQIRSLLNVSELPSYSNIEIVALYNGLGLAVSKTNTSLAGIPLKHGIKKFILKFTTDDGTFVRVPFAVYVPRHSLPERTHSYCLSLTRPERLSCQVTPERCVELMYAVSYATNISITNLAFKTVKEKICGGSFIEFYDHSHPLDVCRYAELHEQKRRLISREGIQQPTKEFKSRLGEKYIIQTVFMSTPMPCFNFEENDPLTPIPNENVEFNLEIDIGTVKLDL